MTNVTQVITSVGFPIVACLGLAWYVKSLTDRMFEITNKFNSAIDNLSDKVDRLLERCDNNGDK